MNGNDDPSVSRRRLLQVLGGASVAGAGGGAVTTASAQADSVSWRKFRGDTNNTGFASAQTGPTENPELAWSVETAVGVPSSPTVVDDTVYVGSGDANVYALSTDDGSVRWTHETGAAVASSPLVVDGTVYVGSGDANVYALSADDGSERWRYETGEGVFASPTIADDTVVVASRDQRVYGLSTDDGTELWRFETDGEIWSSPAIDGGTVYVGSRDQYVYALSTDDGSEHWRYETGDWIESSPAVSGDTLYVGSLDGSVYALSSADGSEKWRAGLSTVIASSPAVDGDTVYVGSRDQHVYALSMIDGTELWSFETDGRVFSSPAVADGVVYVGSADTTVYAVSADDGSEVWSYDTEGEIFSSPAIDNGTLYVGSNDAAVYALADPESAGNDGVTGLMVPAALGALGLGSAGLIWTYRRGGDESEPGTGGSGSGPPAAGATEATSAASGRAAPAPSTDRSSTDWLASGTTPSVEERMVPTDIPTAPPVSVEYDAFTDETSIGSGGNADVTRATLDTGDGSVSIAIKRPRLSGTIDAGTIDQILTEAETWQKLDDHDHIVDVIDYGAQPLPWIAMEYMDGGDLGDRISEIEIEQAIWTALAVTNGVHHAHRQGIAHLDLKPENILFRSVEDAWDVPKVSDWGLAKELLNHSKSIEGFSPQYAAPEQFSDEYGAADDITDVYQLGTVFYELFTGRLPFEGSPARVMQAVLNEDPAPPSDYVDVPPALDDILLTALEKRKDDRYDSLVYLRDALEELYDGHVNK
ncbi:PQQ-binding-like beta-propeller repeat protein [Halobellus salinisoli]|uniref:outer membrane protein assembly factor BamB family protein n=1 Tax=Halobellus salinisoli TaxID=3108500 RepID=UPI003009311D